MFKWFADFFVLFFFLASLAPQAKGEASFKKTIVILQKALLEKDMNVLNQHIALKGIIKGKIKNLASRIKQDSSLTAKLTGKAVDFSEPVLTNLAMRFVLKEFSNSSRGLRQKYLNTLKINQIGEKEQLGYASGSFMSKPVSLSAVKTKGVWVIVAAESAIIDQELNNLINMKREAGKR